MPRFGEADRALEELPIPIDQRDERHRRLEQSRGEPGEAIERLFRGCVEKPGASEHSEPVQVADDIDEIGHASSFSYTGNRSREADYSPEWLVQNARMID